MKYIAYYRVSTPKQGESKLGLEAQKSMIKFLIKEGDELIAEFTDIETAKNTNRENLLKAIELAKKENAVIIVAVLDRLLRKLSHVVTLRDSGVKFLAADSPYANDFEINLRVCFSEEELRKVAERTSNALKEIKNKITKEGFHISKKGNKITSLGSSISNLDLEARNKAVEAIKEKAENNENNKRAKAVIKLLKEKGMTLQQIADELNVAGFKTSTGKKFKRTTVNRLL